MYGDIMNVIASPDHIRHLSSVLEKNCENVGRGPADIQKIFHLPIRIVRDEKNEREIRGDNDWPMISPPQYVIDRIGDFLDVGITEFTPRIPVQKTEIYQELGEEVFSAFD